MDIQRLIEWANSEEYVVLRQKDLAKLLADVFNTTQANGEKLAEPAISSTMILGDMLDSPEQVARYLLEVLYLAVAEFGIGYPTALSPEEELINLIDIVLEPIDDKEKRQQWADKVLRELDNRLKAGNIFAKRYLDRT